MFKVEGLKQNERYIAAIAAYNSQDKIIGGIGVTGKAVIAAHPLPVILGYSYLCKVSLILCEFKSCFLPSINFSYKTTRFCFTFFGTGHEYLSRLFCFLMLSRG